MLSEMEFRKIIGVNIRKRRYAKKYSIEKLAELSETDYSSVNLIENGKQSPKSYTLYKILYALDIDLSEPLKEKNSQEKTAKNQLSEKIALFDEKEAEAVLLLLDKFNINLR